MASLLTKEARQVWRFSLRLVLALCFGLSFAFAFLFALLFAFLLALAFAFAFRECVDFHRYGVVPVCDAPLSVRLMHRFPLVLESLVLLQSRRVQSNVPAPFWILWVVCQYRCFDRVLECV